VVGDAVTVEPVSTVEFPANREKNREFLISRADPRFEAPGADPTGAILPPEMRGRMIRVSGKEAGTVMYAVAEPDSFLAMEIIRMKVAKNGEFVEDLGP
jgi:hypothetical protein